jgi:Fur family transcriptional regulator, ferric uptake regulator
VEERDWHAELRARGFRLTPQRQLVLEAVVHLGHATPDEIAEQVRRTASGVNISTVYRTLELLEELGLVTHTHLGHGAPTYHAAEDADHLHLVCRVCGGIEEVAPDVVEESVQRLAH